MTGDSDVEYDTTALKAFAAAMMGNVPKFDTNPFPEMKVTDNADNKVPQVKELGNAITGLREDLRKETTAFSRGIRFIAVTTYDGVQKMLDAHGHLAKELVDKVYRDAPHPALPPVGPDFQDPPGTK